MNFTVSSSTLNSRLQTLSKVLNPKNSLPILECFLFEVKGNTLTLTASDGENVAKAQVLLEDTDADGSFAVRSSDMLDTLKELPEQPIIFKVNLSSNTIDVRYQNGEYHIVGEDANVYPQTPVIEDESSVFTIDAGVLLNAVSRSIFAIANEEIHPAMNGICFDLTKDHLAIVSCDGHKLVRSREHDIKSEVPSSFILPRKPAGVLKTILDKGIGDVVVKFTQQAAQFNFENGSLYCRLIEGKFPNYNAVVSQNNPNKMIINRKSMLSSIRRVLPFASESSELVRLHIESGKLEISSEDLDFAKSAKESLYCEYDGNPMNIGFRGTGLMEVLSNLECESVQFDLADPSRPGLMHPSEESGNEDVLMMLMPMLLSE